MISSADLVVVVHFSFVLFVIFGGFLVYRWPAVAWLHVPAVIWGVLVEFAGWICPLTPLENRLREAQGEAAYQGDFVARYILAALYPEGLTRTHQVMLGAFALLLNVAIYTVAFTRRRRYRRNGI